MQQKIDKFLEKHNISAEDIKYIVREDGKTAVYTIDGRIISTYHTIKDFREILPIEQFLYPNKGIIAAASQIVSVNNGAYEMADGRVFKYRVHNNPIHDNRLLMLGRRLEHMRSISEAQQTETLASRFSVLDKLPMAVCVLEVVMDENGFDTSFIFRYCNQYLLELEHLTADQVLNHAYQDVFVLAENRWLVTYADVALNGTVRIIEEFDPRRNMDVRIFCYSPLPNYCVCAMTPLDLSSIPRSPEMFTARSIREQPDREQAGQTP